MLAKTLFCFFLSAWPVLAAVATRTTTVHVKPDSGSGVVLTLQPGDRLPEAITVGGTPAGWTAVSLPGPHDVFVENRFIGKNLDVKPGSPLHLSAGSDAPVLTRATSDDKVEITGLRGRWTQLRLDQPVTGYLFGSGVPSTTTPTTPTVTTVTLQDEGVVTGPVITPSGPQAGSPVDRTAAERESLAALPRLFEGVLASTRSPLRPRRPYDFALQTKTGTRFAYLNLTRVLINTPVENYLNHPVVVYGIARPVPDTKDIVITVESIQLR